MTTADQSVLSKALQDEEIGSPAAVEAITDGLEPLALIIRKEFDEPGVHFFTPVNFSQQVAVMKHKSGKRIHPHLHNVVYRQVLYTQEVLVIRKGRIRVDLYSSQKKLVASRILDAGDLILLCGGAHGFEVLETTSMVEVKQGPYAGENDKTFVAV